MYKPQTNSEYASNQTVYNGRNTSSGKALACWFFICTNLKHFFPSPLWLPPGRRTLLCWLNELRKCMHYIPLWGFESGAKSYHIMPVPKRRPPETQQNHNNRNHNRKTNPHHEQKLARYNGSNATAFSACELTDLAQKTTKKAGERKQSKIKRRWTAKTHRPAMPKPRIPPARIPEIALRSLPA